MNNENITFYQLTRTIPFATDILVFENSEDADYIEDATLYKGAFGHMDEELFDSLSSRVVEQTEIYVVYNVAKSSDEVYLMITINEA